ncbi:MAG: hypothetical protein DRR04_13985 [Gammaproteobacteria bacterium]|nr:MAG: hypothetical protein DRR04_13985 [Gammaproteobacteria bacterium]
MYRYSVNNVITYTSEDLILFKESPFASWMERLTLENPDHGISPDLDRKFVKIGRKSPYDIAYSLNAEGRTAEPVEWEDFILAREPLSVNKTQKRNHMTDLFHAEGGDVALVEWHMDEPQRRAATLEAMQSGADFIVNGQLSVGPLSGSVNLLIRSGGVSELGDYFYIPCDTLQITTLHCAFHLCYAAELLHSMQGTLPPQMLIIRAGAEMVSLQTEDHIHHFRAVKYRFMTAQLSFRKHRMPEPAESSHFGRWSNCAHDVLKRRALSNECQARASVAEASGAREYHRASASSKLRPWVWDSEKAATARERGSIEEHRGGIRTSPDNRWRQQVDQSAPPINHASTVMNRELMIDRDTPDPIVPGESGVIPEPTSPKIFGPGDRATGYSDRDGSCAEGEQRRLRALDSVLITSDRRR